jgi:uncharacterized protein DUF3592
LASTNEASTSERADAATLIVGAVFFLIGAALGGVGLWQLYEEQREFGPAEQARGEVLRKAIHADRTRGSIVKPRYRVEYRFQPRGGAPVSGSADLAPELWQRLEPGAALEVRYLGADPSARRVEGELRDPTVWMVFALIGALFAPVGAWLMRNGLPRERAGGERGAIPAPLAAWFTRSPALALGTMGVLFFACFFLGGVFWLGTVRSTQELLEVRGQQVEGLVLSKAIVTKRSGSSGGSRSGESTHHQVVYRFTADGADIVGTSELGADEWQALKERGPIAVVYAGGTPWIHRIEGDSAGWIAPLAFVLVGGLGMLGSAAAAFWFARRAPRPARARREAPLPAAAAPPLPTRKGVGRGWMIGAGVGALFFIGGCGALFTGVSDFLLERRYAAEGRLADAELVDKGIAQAERGGRRSTEYAAGYRFRTPDGERAEGRTVLTVTAWEAAKPGDRLRVRYLASDPRTSRGAEEGGYAIPMVLMIIGPLFALVGAFVAWGSWLSRNDA